MRAFASGAVPGWVVGLQGASDTLGGAAEFEQGRRESEAVLGQRQREEERRQQQFQLEREQAMRKIQAQESLGQAQFGMAQQEFGRRQDQLLQEMMGGPPTVDQGQEIERLGMLAQHLSPDNAESLLKEYRGDRAKRSASQAMAGAAQELMRPLQEGTVQDPQTQQQLQLYGQVASQLGQMVESGAISSEDAPGLLDRLMAKQQETLQGYAKRQADLQVRQATMQQIDMHKQGLPAGDPRLSRLNEMQQLVGLGMMSPKDVGTMLLKEQFGISDEEMSDFEAFREERDKERTREALFRPAAQAFAIAQEVGAIGRPQQAGAAPNGQAKPKRVPRGALVRLRNAVRSAQSPEEIDAIAAELGITDLSPEDEAFVRGQ